MKNYTLNALRSTLILFLIFSLVGCEAFVRKFTRKPKGEPKKEELVLVPEEYQAPQRTNEQIYREYFMFWKSWHDELINAFVGNLSQKKQLDCLNEEVKNLKQLKPLLKEEKQRKLDEYLRQLDDLAQEIKKGRFGKTMDMQRMTAERIRRNIIKDFSFPKIKSELL